MCVSVQSVSGASVVGVTRSVPGVRGAQWDVTFARSDDDLPLLTVTSYDLLVASGGSYSLTCTRLSQGSAPLGGFLSLGLRTPSSGLKHAGPLPYFISASDLQASLRESWGVEVEVAVEYLQDAGKQWLLTFPPSMANVPPLQLNTTRLLGGNYTAEVTELRNGTAFLGGHFALALGASASYALPHNASAAQVQHAAAGLYNWTGLVQVQRTELDVDSFEWTITFPASAGDVQGFRVAAPLLTGTQAVIEDWTAVNGSYLPLGGNFTLGFDNGYTHTLPFNASALEVQEALRNATSVGNITVSREDYVDGATGYGGFAWRVSFSPLGEPSYPGTVPLIQIGDFSLEGAISSANFLYQPSRSAHLLHFSCVVQARTPWERWMRWSRATVPACLWW